MTGDIHQNIPLETMRVGTKYAITIAPEYQTLGWDKKSHTFVYAQPHKTFRKYVLNHLRNLKACVVDLTYELSPLGRQHYHGYLEVNNVLEFYTYDIHVLKSLGALCIKNITNITEWDTYVKKQSLPEEYNIKTGVTPHF